MLDDIIIRIKEQKNTLYKNFKLHLLVYDILYPRTPTRMSP